jgi:ribose/xylose/arabinose/galactoside ABC-type transport system permease subunit
MSGFTRQLRDLARVSALRTAPGQLGVWVTIAAVLALSGFIAPGFLGLDHLLNVARQVSSLAIVTIGQVFVIATGGIDLSNGMVITLVTVLSATLLDGQDRNLIPVVVLCLGIGSAIGLFNGLIVTKLKVPPLIGTLGVFGILRGVAYVYTNGAPKGSAPSSLTALGNGHVGDIPIAVLYALVFVVVGAVVLKRTTFGRRLLMAGANPRAARLSGVAVERTVTLAYVVSGFMAAAAGLVVAGYIGVGSLSAGNDFNLNSVAAAVIGGTALAGGSGSVVGGAAGALLLGLIVSLMRFLGLPYGAQLGVQGCILALAVFAQSRISRQNLTGL